jgi:DNA-binding winged helix-turn-helix (wHTH) protein
MSSVRPSVFLRFSLVAAGMRIRFGDCVLDPETRELLRRGKTAAVSPKAFRLLEVLIERRPRAVKKDELQDLLWPGVFVAEGNLSRLMNELRKSIGDDAEKPRYIRTVHGFGYAFFGEAAGEAASRPPATAGDLVFKLVWGDREIALEDGENILGRDRDAVAWIDIESVSRHHARVLISGRRAILEDMGSKNGTFLQGKRVTTPAPLSDRDRIRIGSVDLTFRRFLGGVSTRSTRSR